jgi:hypothetical protein
VLSYSFLNKEIRDNAALRAVLGHYDGYD